MTSIMASAHVTPAQQDEGKPFDPLAEEALRRVQSAQFPEERQ